jgi:protease YdgD
LKLCVCFGLTLLAAIWSAAAASADDRRVVVDPNTPPWNAVAKVQTNIGTKCTGVLIGAAVVLTAAHCLYNPRTQAMLQPVSLHVLFGFERDTYRWHRLVARFVIGRGFDPVWPRPQHWDWARLELSEAVPEPPLPVASKQPSGGMEVALAGYNQDRSELLMADLHCHLRDVVTVSDGSAMIEHDCGGTRGTSGGPLLARQGGGGWVVVGINIAAGPNDNIALAPPLDELSDHPPH